MNELSAITLPSHLTDIPEGPARDKNKIGKDDFMKLLLTQLQNQDPLKPMEHQEFSAQLAQFSSLEQLTNIGKGIDKLHGGMGEEQKLQALNMIGRRVSATGNEVSLVEGNPVSIRYTLPENVTATKAVIYDSGGKTVRELQLTGKESGAQIQWDGRSQEGVNLPSGKYTFRVAGVGPNGVPHEAGAELSGVVTGVELEGKDAVLVVRNGNAQSRIELSKVRQVALDAAPQAQQAAPVAPPKLPVMKAAAPAVENDAEIEEPSEVEAPEVETVNETEGWADYPADSERGFRVGDHFVATNPVEVFRP